MNQKIPGKNKEFVLRPSDTRFNKPDHAYRYWSPQLVTISRAMCRRNSVRDFAQAAGDDVVDESAEGDILGNPGMGAELL